MRSTPSTSIPGCGFRRVGLFGGAFNPIHLGHLSVARCARDQVVLDAILFIPTGDPPHKPSHSLAPAIHRLAMVRLAIEGEPTFAVSDFEVRRSAKSYSIDTVTALREQYGPSVQLYFIIGLDAFLDIGSWNRPQELLQACHFIVVGRPGQSFGSLAQVSLLPLTSLESVSQLDAGVLQCIQLPLFSETTLTVLRGPASAISASDIRCRLQKREGVRDLLPGSVESYIIQHDLYVEVSNRTHSEG